MAQVVLPQVTTEIVAVDTIIDTAPTTEQRVPLVVITGDRGPHNKVVQINNKNQFYRYFGKPNITVTGPGHYIVDRALEVTDKVYAVRASVVSSDIESNNDHIANVSILNSSGEGIINSFSTKFNFVNNNKFVYIDYESLVALQLDNLLQNVNDVYSPIAITQNSLGNIVQATLNISPANTDITTGPIYTGEYPFYIYDSVNKEKYRISQIQKFLVNISPNRNKYATNPTNAYYQLTLVKVNNSNVDIVGSVWDGSSTIDLSTNFSARLSTFIGTKIELGSDGKIPSNYTIGSFTSNTSSSSNGLLSDISSDPIGPSNYCFVFSNEAKITTAWESGNLFLQSKFEIKNTLDDADTSTTTKFFFKQGHQYVYVIQTVADFASTNNDVAARTNACKLLDSKLQSLKGQWLYPSFIDGNSNTYFSPLMARQVVSVDSFYVGDTQTNTNGQSSLSVFKSLGDSQLNTQTVDGSGLTTTKSTLQPGLFPDFIRVATTTFDLYENNVGTGFGDGSDNNGNRPFSKFYTADLDKLSNITDSVYNYSTNNKYIIFVAKIKLDQPVNIPVNLYTDATTITTLNSLTDILNNVSNISIDETDESNKLIYFKSASYNYDPYEITSQYNISKHRNIKRNQTNNVLTFAAVGTGKYYNNLYITATRNIAMERYFVDSSNGSIYPYNFIDLKIWEQTIDSGQKLLEVVICSLLPTDNNGNPFKHPVSGKNFFIGNVLNSSIFLRCYPGSNINYLKSVEARAKLLSYLAPNLNSSTNLSVNSFNSTYGGILLSGGEDGCVFNIGTKTINLKHPEVTKTLISIFNGTVYDESGTIDKLDEFINPIYRINYIVTGGYDYSVNLAAIALADKRQDCLCLTDVGTTTFEGIIPGAYQDKVFVQSQYGSVDTPHAAMYIQSRIHNDVEFTNQNIILPSTYYALWQNINIDNNYFISEPVAGNPKTADKDAPIYTVKNEQQQYLLDSRCNPTIRERGNVSYYLDELTMRKKYDGLSYIHCIKFVHKVKVDLADLLRPYLKRKMLPKYQSEMQSIVNSYLSKYSSDTISEKFYSLTDYQSSLSVDDTNSIINVNLSLSIVKGINAIAITLNVQ